MLIIFSDRFQLKLENIVKSIAKDSLTRAYNFKDDLNSKIYRLPNHPRFYKKSIKFNDENIRDYIFKSYVIPYLIDDDKIVILGIYKHNLWNK